MPEALKSFPLFGQRLYLGTPVEFLAWLLRRESPPRTRSIMVANAHTLVSAIFDPELAAAQKAATLSLPDGRPLSLAGKLLGAWEARQLRGPDLLLQAAQAGLKLGTRHYYYGGAPGVARAVAARMKSLARGLKVSGFESPPFRAPTDKELALLAARLRKSRTDILWLGLGAPRQEKVMARLAALGAPCAMLGVGAAFDYISGTKKEAPRWMIRLSLEWLYRFASEPGRLWKRYLLTNPAFACLVAAEYFGLHLSSPQAPAERLLRILCLPPLLEAFSQGRPFACLFAVLMPAWLGRMFWMAGRRGVKQ